MDQILADLAALVDGDSTPPDEALRWLAALTADMTPADVADGWLLVEALAAPEPLPAPTARPVVTQQQQQRRPRSRRRRARRAARAGAPSSDDGPPTRPPFDPRLLFHFLQVRP